MRPQELEALKKLNIPVKAWGSSYRVKVKSKGQRMVTVDGSVKYNRRGRITYIGNVSSPSGIEAISRFYNVDKQRLQQYFDGRIKSEEYKVYRGMSYESHLWKNIDMATFSERFNEILVSQTKSFKVSVQLGYTLIDRITGEEREFHPTVDTAVFGTPLRVNSKKDISGVIDRVITAEHEQRIAFPNSAWMFKGIYAYRVLIYYRNHQLGDDTIKIPDVIKNHHYIVNIPNSSNKCMFACTAYHLHSGQKNPQRMGGAMKQRFKEFCQFKNLTYTKKLYDTFEPIDIMQFHELEECFELNINVYEMDFDTLDFILIRESDTAYPSTMNILDYKGHAMYITNLSNILGKYPCNRCGQVFDSCTKLANHKKTKCQMETIDRFVKKPTIYRPPQNFIQNLQQKYECIHVDHYMDHFIVFDFEAETPETGVHRGERTVYTNKHRPISVSISNSLTYETRCFVNKDENKLVSDMMDYLYNISDEIYLYNTRKFESLASAIEKRESYKRNNIYPKLKVEKDKFEEEWSKYVSNLEVSGEATSGRKLMIERGKMLKHYPLYQAHEKGIERLAKDKNDLNDRLLQVPVIGFNSGRYDINIIKNCLFKHLANSDGLHVIKNPSYMCISNKQLKFLDMINYLPPGVSYDNFLHTNLGDCQCVNKIQCTCGLSKGVFPYEYINSFDKLSETSLPPQEAFDSKLKGVKCSDEQYARVCFAWDYHQMKSIKDLLIWYNNLDVAPFVKAIKIEREFYKRFDLDMFMDGVSLPGLAEKIMYQDCYSNLNPIQPQIGNAFDFPEDRFNGYEVQDRMANRRFDLTLHHVNQTLVSQSFSCAHCKCALNKGNASVDRIDNWKGHINGNIVIACSACNTARKRMPMEKFQFQKQVEANKMNLIHSIDDEQKEIYQMMKDNIAGGPSIIFNRFAKRNETTIRGGKPCKKVIGYDCNAEYLWAIGNVMPCGTITQTETYDGIVQDIMDDKLFGFLVCDIRTPDHLKEYFGEMCPIFKNIEIDPDDVNVVGQHMYEYNQSKGTCRAKKTKKLIGSYFGEKILIYTPLLKWYIQHGLEITRTYSFVKANPYRPFQSFAEKVSNARREGAADPSKESIADKMKLVGNSAFGRSGMDKSKHKHTTIESDIMTVRSIVERNEFFDLEEYDGSIEVTMKKRRVFLNNPIHMSIAIYQLAKLRMLEFYYDFVDYYIDRSDFMYLEMDTDSAYIAFSDENPFPNLIKPELRAHFEENKHKWFPREDTPENRAYDMYTPGLFKQEWIGDAMVSLSSKNYICYLPDEVEKVNKKSKQLELVKPVKISAKGVQKSNNEGVLNPECFEKVVKAKISFSGTNRGFRVCKESKTVITYQQCKTALNYYYDKRQVLSDGITTVPLPI